MLTILNDPAGVTGRASHAWDYSASIQANVERWMTHGGDARAVLNGQQIDPATDAAMDRLPTVADSLTIIRRPAGLDPFTWLLIGIVAASVIMVATMPRLGDMGAAGKDSPNNRLTAQTNQARAYQAIPDVYGSRRVWPDMIQPSVVEYIDHIKYVTEWLCVSRGKGDITAVQYADTPIGDVEGASYTAFTPTTGSDGYPEHGVTTLPNVLETFSSPEVNGQEIAATEPYPPVIRFASSFAATSGAASFTVTVTNGDDLAALKSLAPAGTARVTFSYAPAAGGEATFDATCTVLGYVISGANAVFTFGAPAAWATSESSGATTQVTIDPDGADETTVGPFTLPVECSRLRWNTVFLRGLKGSVQIQAEWWKVNSSGTEIAGTRQTQTDTYAADTYDARYWTTTVTPAAGSGLYRIEFKRLTPPTGDQGTDVAKLEALYAVRHYATKTLPGVTVIRVTTQATEQATGYSERKFNLRWSRHVRTLASGTLSASRNAFRAMAHLWTLAGDAMSELDTAAMQAINDDLGETSPLLAFDMSLDDADMSLGERMQLVADHARCKVWRAGTQWTVTRDQAQAYPVLQLDYRNLAAGGDAATSYAAHLPATRDGIELEYADPTTQSKKSYIRLSIASGSVAVGASANPLKVQLLGCTSAEQAENRARLEARRLLYSRTTVQETVLGDAGMLGLGSLVRYVDPADWDGADDGLQAGEVLSIAGNIITTSEPLQWSGAAVGRIMFTGQHGQRLAAPVLCYPSGSAVQLASVPAGLYVADGVTTQLGSRYVFATGLTDAELEAAGLYTVSDIKPGGDGTASVTLAQYDSRIYADDDL